MRIITAEQKQEIEYLAAEGLVRGLPVQTTEKDINIIETGNPPQLSFDEERFLCLISESGGFTMKAAAARFQTSTDD